MTQTITANELKTKGVTILDEETADGEEVIITVRAIFSPHKHFLSYFYYPYDRE